METHTQSTGSAGTMRMDDSGTEAVDLYLLGINELVDQIPWAYTVNGDTVGWRSFRLEPNLEWQKVGTLWVAISQDITFKIGATGNVRLGGPTDFTISVTRSDVIAGGTGVARIVVHGVYKNATPFVREQGVWKQASSWAKIAGEWKPTK